MYQKPKLHQVKVKIHHHSGRPLTKKQKNQNCNKKIKNVPKTKLGTISLFRNDLELVLKRREPQQRPLSLRDETSSGSPILTQNNTILFRPLGAQYWASGARSKTTRTATTSSITSLWNELLKLNIKFRDGETRLWFFDLLELNIEFREFVS